MKRIFAMFLCLSMILSLASIGLPAHAETVEAPQCTCEPAEDGTVIHGPDCALAAQTTETKPACDQVATCEGEGCEVEGCTCTAHHEPAVISDLPEDNDEPQTVKCDFCGAEGADAAALVHNDDCTAQAPQTVKCEECGAEAADEASLVHGEKCSKRPADKTEEPPVTEEKKCTCTPADDGTHAANCPLYVAPQCTCTP